MLAAIPDYVSDLIELLLKKRLVLHNPELDYVIALGCAGLNFLRVCSDDITAKFISKAKTVEPWL